MVNLDKITMQGKAIYLAYDQGMEHGPSDFNDENIDPSNILKIATEGQYNGVIVQKGIAEKYYTQDLLDKVPLILKLNGKTNLLQDEDPYSPQICSVDEAISLGASAVGYTIYVGSSFEEKMFSEFSQIEKEAHEKNIPVIGWMYIRGSGAVGKDPKELSAYAARLGLELGADIIKVKYPGDSESLKWAVESAGKTKVIVSGGEHIEKEKFLEIVKTAMASGAIGMAVGRNIWQSENPMEMTGEAKKIIFS